MKKPEYTKPFDLEHARAGAPYGCRDGGEVEILKWDRKHTFCIVGLDAQDASVRRWRADGSYNEGFNVFDLVMLPLGFIDGKPVWVGDELQWNVETIKAMPSHKPADLINCTWPAPAPVYPETLMTGQDLARVDGSRMFDTVQPSYEREARLIANAALRHAIDAGQVVLPGGKNDAAHDLAIADAAAKAVYNKIYAFGFQRTAYCDLGLDLPAIIAGVAK